MTQKDHRQPFIRLAYWKKRWVGVPLFHCPDDAITETGELARFKLIPLDGQIIEPLPKRENKAFEKNAASVKESIVPWIWSEKALKELCSRNDITLAWVTDRYPRKGYHTKGGINRREKRKIRSLTKAEFRKIRKELVKLNRQAALILGILWYLNNSLEKRGYFVTLEAIARLQVQDVSPEREDGSNCISLFRIGMYSQLISHSLPPHLWKSLCRQINDNSMYVFSTRNGGPLSLVQINTYLKKAAEMAKITDIITSDSLRPQFNKKRIERAAKKNNWDASVKPYLDPIPVKEWRAICEQIPAIMERKGRKSIHSPLELLNAILYLMRTQCPIRKTPKEFPSWRAVESQQRRWKKAGILDEVIAWRKANREI